jgi:hypothetical protein
VVGTKVPDGFDVMKPSLRKLVLTAHITFSVGWLGAATAYLALAVAALMSRNGDMTPAAYFAMKLIGWVIIVPCALTALLTGLIQSLGTEWGLFRYYWILTKFLLTALACLVLLLHMPTVGHGSRMVSEVVHSGVGAIVLLSTTTLSVYKPWGSIRDGRRQHDPNRDPGGRTREDSTPAQVYVFLCIAAALALLLIIAHVGGGGGTGATVTEWAKQVGQSVSRALSSRERAAYCPF